MLLAEAAALGLGFRVDEDSASQLGGSPKSPCVRNPRD